MRDFNTNIKFKLIFFGIVIGFLFAFFIFNPKNVELRGQNNFSDKKTVELQNQNVRNCTIVEREISLSNLKLNESADLSEIEKVYRNKIITENINYTTGLLSPRIYSGILEPRSFLITNFDALEQSIQSYLEEQNISASVYIENFRNGVNIGVNEDEGYFPASLNKLPIAILIMQRIEDGKLSLDSMLPIEDNDRTDSYGTLYLTKEKELSVKILLEKMLRESDNTAFNVLFEHIERSELTRLLDYYNIKENIEYPFKRLQYGASTNLVTPILMYNIFSSLYLSTVLYAQDSEYILSLLSNTEFDVEGFANIPYNTTVSHKFGEYYLEDTKLFHDCGIIYIDHSRIFYCIMMKNIEPNNAKEAIGYLVSDIYNYVINERTRLDALKNHKS